MKRLFQNLPIRLKLTTAIMAASFFVLVLFSSAFVIDSIYSFRKSMIDDITVMADLIGTNTKSSLMLNKKHKAKEVLAALKAQPHIKSAILFDLSGKPIAQYLDHRDHKFVNEMVTHDFTKIKLEEWNLSQTHIIHYDWSHLSLFAPIFHQEEKVGTIYLLSDNETLYGRIYTLLLGALLSLGGIIPLSLIVVRYLSRSIAEPLFHLVSKMTAVSRKNDFTIRAEKISKDEVGELVDGFNDMLTQIEIRDGRLADHQSYLEDTVSNRTKELQQTVESLEAAKQVAVSANNSKSQFLANMTHELRTPLIGVLGMNEILARTELSDQQQSLVATVQRSGEDLLAMISDILDFSKIEAGHMQLETVDTDIFTIVEETTHLLSEKARDKDLNVSCQVMPAALWKVQTDPVRVRQILLNLISNAIKFTPQGTILVRLDMKMSGHDLGCFSIEVEDTGVGMTKAEQEKVFSAFVQADSTTTRQFGGTGLGLSIVQQLVALMGGKLSLESRVGVGSTFRVELSLPLVSTQVPRLPDSLRGRRILVSDDSSFEQATMQKICSELGMQVTLASSVEDAWYRLLAGSRQEIPFDLALIPATSTLPDGCFLFKKISQEVLLSGLRLIVTSGTKFSSEEYSSDEITVLEKPILWSSLVQCLVRSWNIIELVSPVVEKKKEQTSFPETMTINSTATHHRILLVDDNAVTRELVCLSLVKYPLEIEQAVSGTDALDALTDNHYDLILMDCNMPGIDGMETTRRLRTNGCVAPVIAMTAHLDQRIFDACKESGMCDSLRKPFRQKELHELIEKWLKIRKNSYSSHAQVKRQWEGGE